jgi:hypothetical protein
MSFRVIILIISREYVKYSPFKAPQNESMPSAIEVTLKAAASLALCSKLSHTAFFFDRRNIFFQAVVLIYCLFPFRAWTHKSVGQ